MKKKKLPPKNVKRLVISMKHEWYEKFIQIAKFQQVDMKRMIVMYLKDCIIQYEALMIEASERSTHLETFPQDRNLNSYYKP